MLRTFNGCNYGVLNDWDLSVVNNESPDVGDHIATIPFLAADLLHNDYWDGKIKVLYRHDLESFVWILFWVLCCYTEGKEVIPPTLALWKSTDIVECRARRLNIISQFDDVIVQPGWKTEWPVLIHLTDWLILRHLTRLHARRSTEVPDQEVLVEFLGHLKAASESPGLEYLRDQPQL
jgi:hypothetical protein